MRDHNQKQEGTIAERYALDYLRLVFRDKASETRYQRETLSSAINHVRLYVGAGAACYALFGLLDYHLLSGPTLYAILALRFGFVVSTLLIVFAFTFHKRFYEFAQAALFCAMLSSGIGILAMIAILPSPYNGTYYAGIIMVAAYCGTLIRLKFIVSSSCAAFLMLGYQAVVLYINPIPFAIHLSNTFFLAMAVGVGLFTSYLHELYMRRAYIGDIIIRAQNEKSRALLIEARVANKAKSEFLATMSHELRTPLNAVCGFSEIIKSEMFGPIGQKQYADYASDIHNSGTHLLSIINDILDIAKAEAGKLQLSETTVDLPDAVLSCVRMCRASADKKNITVNMIGFDKVLQILGDERLIRQAVLNLLSNAIKFTDAKGRIDIKLDVLNGGDVSVSVSDTGVGIAKEDIERVLQPFEQVEGALARQNGGTGLGLPYSEKIAQIHGGRLALESTLGEGTECQIILPNWRMLDVVEPEALREAS